MYLLIYIHWIVYLNAAHAHYYTQWNHNDDERNLEEYPATELSNPNDRMYVKYDVQPEGGKTVCVNLFHSMPSCKAFNIIKLPNDTLKCLFFSSSRGGKILKNDDSTLFKASEEGQQCSGYCEELSYLKMCSDECACVSLCTSVLPHYCDCTTSKKIVKNCDTSIQVFDHPLAGQYYMNSSSETFIGFCQIDERNLEGDLSLTVYRHLRVKNPSVVMEYSRAEYTKGFGRPYDETYFIGYKRLAEYTKGKSHVRLSLQFTASDRSKYYIDYNGFRMEKYTTDKGRVKYQVEYDSVYSLQCMYNIIKNAQEIPKKCPRFDLFGDCDKLVWQFNFASATFLLRDQENAKPSPSSARTITLVKQHLLREGINIRNQFCIHFEFMVENKNIGKFNAVYVRYEYGQILYDLVALDIRQYHFDFWDKYNSEMVVKMEKAYQLNVYHAIQISLVPMGGEKWLKSIYLNGKLLKEDTFNKKGDIEFKKAQIDLLFGDKNSRKLSIRNFYFNGQLLS